MGLSVSVGYLAELRGEDPEGAAEFAGSLTFAGRLLEEAGLPPHVEPEDCECWNAQMYGYSGLHYLRRIAAHLDAGLPLPTPGNDKSSDDPVLNAYFDDVTGERPGILKRLLKTQPRFQRTFDHVIVHSDAEGFYLPQDFPQVLFADDNLLPGGMLGSAPRLLAELDRLAVALGIPDDIHSNSEDLWEASDSQGEGEALWQRYGIESYSCVVLREACRKSINTGAAIVFC